MEGEGGTCSVLRRIKVRVKILRPLPHLNYWEESVQVMPSLSPGWPACRRVHSALPGLPRVDNVGQGLARGLGFEVLSASTCGVEWI